MKPMDFIAMDLIGEFHPPSSNGNRYALMGVCMLTGFTWCILIKSKKAPDVARTYMQHVYSILGGSTKILTDNGTEFKNEVFKEMLQSLGTEKLVHSPPYRPQSNGRIEGFHCYLKACIAKHMRAGLEWDEVTAMATAAYNHFPNMSTKESAFFLMYGRDPVNKLSVILNAPRGYLGDVTGFPDLEALKNMYQMVAQPEEQAGLGVTISKEHDTQITIFSTSSTKPLLPLTSESATSVPTTDRYVTVKDNLLASIPVSKYAESITASSKDTVKYWPLDEHEQRRLLQTPTSSVLKNIQQKTFAMSTHGIRRRKRRYYFKCKIGLCNKSYSNIRDWNAHHRRKHGTLIRCTSCPKKFTTPSAHRAHIYTHFPARHKCTQCSCKFAFVSWLKQHKYAHMKTNLHKCFYGNCKKLYRWPQDLSRHIAKHFDKLWSCTECDMTFKEKRLLKRHVIKHTNVYRYKCKRCRYRTKWPTPYRHHVLKCK